MTDEPWGPRGRNIIAPQPCVAIWGQEGWKGIVPCFVSMSELRSNNKQSQISVAYPSLTRAGACPRCLHLQAVSRIELLHSRLHLRSPLLPARWQGKRVRVDECTQKFMPRSVRGIYLPKCHWLEAILRPHTTTREIVKYNIPMFPHQHHLFHTPLVTTG